MATAEISGTAMTLLLWMASWMNGILKDHYKW
jgi:hypothetical protein